MNLDGLVGAVGNVEKSADKVAKGLNKNSSAADLTKANLEISKYSIYTTAANGIIEKDGKAREAAARPIGS